LGCFRRRAVSQNKRKTHGLEGGGGETEGKEKNQTRPQKRKIGFSAFYSPDGIHMRRSERLNFFPLFGSPEIFKTGFRTRLHGKVTMKQGRKIMEMKLDHFEAA